MYCLLHICHRIVYSSLACAHNFSSSSFLIVIVEWLSLYFSATTSHVFNPRSPAVCNRCYLTFYMPLIRYKENLQWAASHAQLGYFFINTNFGLWCSSFDWHHGTQQNLNTFSMQHLSCKKAFLILSGSFFYLKVYFAAIHSNTASP